MRAAEAAGRALAQLGVRNFFGLVGSGNFHLTNGLIAGGARFIAARHETGAVTMADAYARASGELGVCTVHQGPGVTNAVTGLTEAAKSRTPLLLLAGEATAPRSNFFIEQAGLAAAVGALHRRLSSPGAAVAEVVEAARIATAERRTVLLSMPLEVQAGECDPPSEIEMPAAHPAGPAPSAADVDALVKLLSGAKRPLLLAGRGAVLSNAREAIERLAWRSGALLATSGVAYGLFAGNPWYLGISGGFATPLAAELIEQSDAVVAFGASLNMWTTRRGHLIGANARVAQVDIDAGALGAHRPVDLAIAGDCRATASAVSDALHTPPPGWRSEAMAERIRHGSWREQPFDDLSGDGHIDPRALSIALDALLPSERVLAVDSGHFMGWPPMYMDVPDGRSFVFTQSYMSIGLGLATGIGAAIARPDRVAVIALGDGGALMALPEFETLGRLGLGALVVVYNDASYAAEVHHFAPEKAPMEAVTFPDTDFAAVARALGFESATVRGLADIEVVADWLKRGRPGPLLLDAKVARGVVAEWLEEAFRGH